MTSDGIRVTRAKHRLSVRRGPSAAGNTSVKKMSDEELVRTVNRLTALASTSPNGSPNADG